MITFTYHNADDFYYYETTLFNKFILSFSITNGKDGWLWYDTQAGMKVKQIVELAYINNPSYFLMKLNILITSFSFGCNR